MATKSAVKEPTPSMRQYWAAKEQYPDALIFFRMGDFYELFYEDAVTASSALDLKLTSRDKSDDPIPMAGVPHHAAQIYLARLLEQGFNVAVCEQIEDPAKTKGLVKRAVVRVLTPALVLDGDALAPRANQFLAAVTVPDGGVEASGAWGFAAYDLTTGELFVGETADATSLTGELSRMDVRELVVPPEAEAVGRNACKLLPRMFLRVQVPLGAKAAAEVLAEALGEERMKQEADGFSAHARTAAGVALSYAKASQPGHTVGVQRMVRLDPRDYLVLDETAQQHLELFVTTRGEKKGSLLSMLDETVTPMGARRLRTWVAFPLLDTKRIKRRHDAVGALVTAADARGHVREELRGVADVERIAIRCTLGAATPRDLASLRDALVRVPKLHAALELAGPALKGLRAPDECAAVRDRLLAALAEAPSMLGESAVFREGFHAGLDKLTKLATGGRDAVAEFERRERERSKITSLKVAYNRVFGYYIEVTKSNLKSVPAEYKRKQTIAGGERFITEELYELEKQILSAEDEGKALEAELFASLVAEIGRSATSLSRLANVLADMDALCSFAEIAHRFDYVRPEMDDGSVIDLKDARHPVVENALEPGAFVPNDVTLDQKGERLLLVTGPNMAGKSTLMRMVALAVVMAQAGGFVPAGSARIGAVDRVFTRVGASDDLSRGQSTFMVEMRETSAILRGATTRSLVVFDEIGRGTSTYDGLAIAWSVAEYLHDVVRCRALFATHYHELCSLADSKKHAANVNVSAREVGDDIVFLHKLQSGGASRSYGIAVARLAGLPEPVVARARALLRDLERGEGPGARSKQTDLFEPKEPAKEHPLVSAVRFAEVDRMTPLDALNFIAQLRGMIGKE